MSGKDATLVVAAPVQAALALLRAGEVMCHSRQQWEAAQALLQHGWTADELMRMAELCVSEAVARDTSLPPTTELDARNRDLAATVQGLQACGIGAPVWCLQMRPQNSSKSDTTVVSEAAAAVADTGAHNGAVIVTFKSLTGMLSALQHSTAPRVVLKRFPAMHALLHGEHGP